MSNATTLSWLLAAHTPSIRYLALRGLLDRPEDDAAVQAARRDTALSGPIPAILAGQTERGDWAGERSYYTPKYTSTHWSMTLLAELAADGQDARLGRGTGSMLAETEAGVQKDHHGWTCFWGNLLRYACHSGLAGDPRIACLVDRVARDAIQAGWRCPHNEELPCAWGAARALWGLAALPAERRSPQASLAIASGLSFLLEDGRLTTGGYPTSGRVHAIWGRVNFPLFYQADILFVLRVALELNALDRPGVGLALAWLAMRRHADGTWRGSSPFRKRTWSALAAQEEIDRWVTLHAEIVLKAAASL